MKKRDVSTNSLAEVLGKYNLSQAKVANGASLKREYVNRVSRGKITPTVTTALKIVNSINDLIDGNLSINDIWKLEA